MENGQISKATMQDIADAIREKDGSTAQIYPENMGDAIRAITTGGAYEANVGQVTIGSLISTSSSNIYSIDHGLSGAPDYFIQNIHSDSIYRYDDVFSLESAARWCGVIGYIGSNYAFSALLFPSSSSSQKWYGMGVGGGITMNNSNTSSYFVITDTTVSIKTNVNLYGVYDWIAVRKAQ